MVNARGESRTIKDTARKGIKKEEDQMEVEVSVSKQDEHLSGLELLPAGIGSRCSRY